MENVNLFRYYERLDDFALNQEYPITLAQLSDAMFTSPRHARSILKQMSHNHWIVWVPRSGRNQRSTFIKKLTELEVKRHIASNWVKENKYDRALEFLDNDQTAFGQLLQQHSGAQVSEGRVNVQLTYNRAFARLVPHVPQRNSERFLIRQVHACLVGTDLKGEPQADIAHHWESSEDHKTWTFYLRPSVYFHNGRVVDANIVASLLLRLREQRYYRHELDHVLDINVKPPYSLTVTLSRPDQGFAALLSDVKYSIQLPEQLVSTDNHIVGCGVFSLTEHTQTLLSLKANEQYYGLRSLTDGVSIWSVDDGTMPLLNDPKSCNHNVSAAADPYPQKIITHPEIDLEQHQEASTTSRARIEHGCLFMVFNQKNKSLSYEQRRWLTHCLSSKKIWRQLVMDNHAFGAELAFNFFPFWHNVKRMVIKPVDLPSEISIAFYSHSGVMRSAKAIQELLALQDVKVHLNLYSYEQFVDIAVTTGFQEEIVLSGLNLDDNRQVSALLFFLSDPILHATIGEEFGQWIINEINHIRATFAPSEYLAQLEQLGSLLIHEGIVSPMFHHRQTLSFQGILKGVEITTWGWPQLRDVWSSG